MKFHTRKSPTAKQIRAEMSARLLDLLMRMEELRNERAIIQSQIRLCR
jgi:hypothetical protein